MYFLFTMSENPQFSKSAVRFKIYCETLLNDAAGAFAKAVSMIAASGGARRDRTDDLMLAKHALSQLSYGPSFAEASEGSRPHAHRVGVPTEAARQRRLVGLGRLELPTSRLSSARSNQLSYKPEPVAGLPAEANRTALLARPGRKRNEDGGVPHDWPDWPLILKSFDKVRTR